MPTDQFDYSHVTTTARVALYDDLKSAPRITEIQPDTTNEYIEKLTTTIYEQAKLAGGKVPYTLIREVSENFIHAKFQEIVVSILDDGNTIRFADQGPGIQEKEKAQKPGFSSAIEPMKKYIRGVGSGFPIVKDYLDDREGTIIIEDNLVSGAVVTISLEKKPSEPAVPARQTIRQNAIRAVPPIPLSEREKAFMMGISARELDEKFPEEEMVLIQGIIDAWFIEDDEIVLLDYKTDRVKQAVELVSRYKIQLELYKRALEASTMKKVKEVLIYSFALGEVIELDLS